MNELPAVKRVALEHDLVTVCKELIGPYENVKEYVTTVKDYLAQAQIPSKPFHAFGVYFDDYNTWACRKSKPAPPAGIKS